MDMLIDFLKLAGGVLLNLKIVLFAGLFLALWKSISAFYRRGKEMLK